MTNDSIKIRTEAAKYAKAFLVNKYKQEYQELYDAFLTNRGFTTRRNVKIVDERLVNE